MLKPNSPLTTVLFYLLWLIPLFCSAQSPEVAQQQSAPAEVPTFDIWEFQIRGNSRLASIDIERSVYAHLGPEKTIEDVEKARAALSFISVEVLGFGG